MTTGEERKFFTRPYKARLYDPAIGRFISPDSVVPEPGNLQALNRYSYCVNNPVTYVDPSGHSWLDDLMDSVSGWSKASGYVGDMAMGAHHELLWRYEGHGDVVDGMHAGFWIELATGGSWYSAAVWAGTGEACTKRLYRIDNGSWNSVVTLGPPPFGIQ